MEELLNKLIQMWWHPFGWDDKLSSLHKEYGVWKWYIRFHNWMDSESFDLRQLTSKESGLWQFVCKNWMIKKNSNDDKYNSWQKNMYNSYLKRDRAYAEYRLIGSALCDEDKLEKFLLANIKVS